jgi:hypothetical protein
MAGVAVGRAAHPQLLADGAEVHRPAHVLEILRRNAHVDRHREYLGSIFAHDDSLRACDMTPGVSGVCTPHPACRWRPCTGRCRDYSRALCHTAPPCLPTAWLRSGAWSRPCEAARPALACHPLLYCPIGCVFCPACCCCCCCCCLRHRHPLNADLLRPRLRAGACRTAGDDVRGSISQRDATSTITRRTRSSPCAWNAGHLNRLNKAQRSEGRVRLASFACCPCLRPLFRVDRT